MMSSEPRQDWVSRSSFPRSSRFRIKLLGSTIALGVIEDPELVDWTHIAVYTRLRTTAEEAAAKQLRWCDSLRERIGNAATSFTLLVDLECMQH